jgi:hypothetical protein
MMGVLPRSSAMLTVNWPLRLMNSCADAGGVRLRARTEALRRRAFVPSSGSTTQLYW